MEKESADYCQVVKPDYEIKIGIKDCKVVAIDFSGIRKHEKIEEIFGGKTNIAEKKVLEYLDQTKKILLKK